MKGLYFSLIFSLMGVWACGEYLEKKEEDENDYHSDYHYHTTYYPDSYENDDDAVSSNEPREE